MAHRHQNRKQIRRKGGTANRRRRYQSGGYTTPTQRNMPTMPSSTRQGSPRVTRSSQSVSTVQYQGSTFEVRTNRNNPSTGTWNLKSGNIKGLMVPGAWVGPPSGGDSISSWPTDHHEDNSPDDVDCFDRTSIVELENGESISISNLEIGDKVKTINKKGEVEYSEVYAWFHKSYDDYRDDYINVKTDNNRTLTITPGHRIYVNGIDSPASDIKVGDTVTGQKVISVETVTAYGKYAPATKTGFIMVDGVNCSCYAFYGHDFCHAVVNLTLKPLTKIFPSFGSWFNKDGKHRVASLFDGEGIIGKLLGRI